MQTPTDLMYKTVSRIADLLEHTTAASGSVITQDLANAFDSVSLMYKTVSRIADLLEHTTTASGSVITQDLATAFDSVSFDPRDNADAVHLKFAHAAERYYKDKRQIPPPNVRTLVLWAMTLHPDTNSEISEYAVRELFMNKPKTTPPPKPLLGTTGRY